MRLQRLVGLTFVSVFVQEAVDFMKIKLTPVCLQSGEAFEVTIREERHNDGSLAADCGGRRAGHNGAASMALSAKATRPPVRMSAYSSSRSGGAHGS